MGWDIKRKKPAYTLCFLALGLLNPMASESASPVGNWFTGVLDEKAGIYAATANDSGQIFGEYCFFSTKSCQWRVMMDSACEAESTYPSLGNTDHGAGQLEMYCVGKADARMYVLAFRNWKNLEELVKQSSRLGIAVPMQEDQFKVYRFSLNGLAETTTEIERDFYSAMKPKPSSTNSTKTQTL